MICSFWLFHYIFFKCYHKIGGDGGQLLYNLFSYMLISWKCLLRGKEEGEAPPPPPPATCLKIKRCGKYVNDVFFVFMRMCTGSWILKLCPTSYKIQSFVIKLSSLVKIHIIIKPKSLIDFIKYWDCYLCDCALALSFSLILWIISCNKYFFPIEILKNLISKIKNLKKICWISIWSKEDNQINNLLWNISLHNVIFVWI